MLNLGQNSYWESLVALIYPRVCENCSRPLIRQEDLLCTHCLMDLPKTNYHKTTNNPLFQQLGVVSHIDGAFCYLKFSQSGQVQNLLHKLKYRQAQTVGFVLAQWFAEEIQEQLDSAIDYIVPVPLHTKKLRQRGYNQAEVISNGMADIINIPVKNYLKRTKHQKSQSQKDKIGRWQDTDGLYVLKKGIELEGKNVLVVDDVITTGATILAAVDALRSGGANRIYVACLATGK